MSFPQNAVNLHVLKQIHLNAIETVSGPECYIVVSFKIFFDRIYPNIQMIISNIVGVAFRPEGTAQRIGACHRLLSAEDLGTGRKETQAGSKKQIGRASWRERVCQYV